MQTNFLVILKKKLDNTAWPQTHLVNVKQSPEKILHNITIITITMSTQYYYFTDCRLIVGTYVLSIVYRRNAVILLCRTAKYYCLSIYILLYTPICLTRYNILYSLFEYYITIRVYVIMSWINVFNFTDCFQF